MTDVRVEIFTTAIQAATRQGYLEQQGFNTVLCEQVSYITVDSREVGGQEDPVTATSPIWVLVTTTN